MKGIFEQMDLDPINTSFLDEVVTRKLPTESEVDASMKLGSVIEETAERIITSGDIGKGKCQYYTDRSKSCAIVSCKHGHRLSDRSCMTEGVIDDLYRDKQEHHYFQSRGKL